jgi:hypothetical protein
MTHDKSLRFVLEHIAYRTFEASQSITKHGEYVEMSCR